MNNHTFESLYMMWPFINVSITCEYLYMWLIVYVCIYTCEFLYMWVFKHVNIFTFDMWVSKSFLIPLGLYRPYLGLFYHTLGDVEKAYL